MDKPNLCERLREIAEALAVPPRSLQGGVSVSGYISHIPARTGQSPDQLLDYLRLRVKYLTFDLEATRRENQYLRRMLERRRNLEEPPESS